MEPNQQTSTPAAPVAAPSSPAPAPAAAPPQQATPAPAAPAPVAPAQPAAPPTESEILQRMMTRPDPNSPQALRTPRAQQKLDAAGLSGQQPAVADPQQAQQPVPGTEDPWSFGGKYKSPADLANAHRSLQTELNQRSGLLNEFKQAIGDATPQQVRDAIAAIQRPNGTAAPSGNGQQQMPAAQPGNGAQQVNGTAPNGQQPPQQSLLDLQPLDFVDRFAENPVKTMLDTWREAIKRDPELLYEVAPELKQERAKVDFMNRFTDWEQRTTDEDPRVKDQMVALYKEDPRLISAPVDHVQLLAQGRLLKQILGEQQRVTAAATEQGRQEGYQMRQDKVAATGEVTPIHDTGAGTGSPRTPDRWSSYLAWENGQRAQLP